LKARLLLALLLLVVIMLSSLPSAAAASQVKVYLQPSRQQVSPGDTLTVTVYVDPGEAGLSAGEFHVAYPSSLLKAQKVEVGELFGDNPLIGMDETEIVGEREVVKLALARVGETGKLTPPGIALTIKLEVLQTASSGSYTINLLKVDLVDEAFNRIEDVQIQECTITVEAFTPTPTSTTTPTPTQTTPKPSPSPTPSTTGTAVPSPSKVVVLVLDEATGAPLAGVKVRVNGYEAVTGEDGRAAFVVSKVSCTVTASLEGYREKSMAVTASPGEETLVELRLKPEAKPGGGCLIATAAFGSEMAPQVQALRNFRDCYVMATRGGLAFMKTFNSWYYSWSPTIAELERENPALKTAVKGMIYLLLVELEAVKAVYPLLSFSPELAVLTVGVLASMLIALTYLSPFAFLASAFLGGRVRLPKNLFQGCFFFPFCFTGLAFKLPAGFYQ
jgi:hypothetical protein